MQRKNTSTAHQVRSFALEIRATGNSGEVEGYGSVFGVKDSYDDVIQAGAFLKSISEHKAAGTMPAMLWQHDADEPIGVWREISEDARGLRIKGQLALDTVRGKEAFALLKLGALNGLSIGFMSKQWEYNRDTEVRTLTEIDLWEVSLVTFPANQAARVTGVKSAAQDITTIRQAEHAMRDAGLPADEAKALIAAVKRIALSERDAHNEADAAMKAAQRLLSSLTP